jgi:hypothetical protein
VTITPVQLEAISREIGEKVTYETDDEDGTFLTVNISNSAKEGYQLALAVVRICGMAHAQEWVAGIDGAATPAYTSGPGYPVYVEGIEIAAV